MATRPRGKRLPHHPETSGCPKHRYWKVLIVAGHVTLRQGGVTLRSHPLCIGYYDPADGSSVRLAEITNAIGWLVNSNEVVYSNCFNGLRASIRIRNARSGMEQDLLIHEQPLFTPSDFGLSELTRLELFTEFIGNTPAPQVKSRVLSMEKIPPGRAQIQERQFTDSSLDFGPLKMAAGRAFSTGKRGVQSRARERMDAAPVGKRLEVIEGRKILIEAVPVRYIDKVLAKLPRPAVAAATPTPSPLGGERAGVRGATPSPLGGERVGVRGNDLSPILGESAVLATLALRGPASARPPAAIPLSAPGGEGRGEVAVRTIFQPQAGDEIRSLPGKRLALNASPDQKILQSASLNPNHDPVTGEGEELAFVLDYETISTESLPDQTFKSDQTYRISGMVSLTGTTTFEGGTVIKYDELLPDYGSGYGGGPYGQVYAVLMIFGPVVCATDPYHPAVFTSVYDNSVGQVVASGKAPELFYQAIAIDNSTTTTLSNIHVRYAQYGLHTASIDVHLRHAQFDHCWTTFYPEWGQWNLANVLVHDTEVFSSGAYYQFVATHLTVNDCRTALLTSWSDPAASAASIYNHILTDVAELGSVGSDHSNLTGNDILATAGLFQTVGGDHHYLAANSPYRNTAPAAVDPGLAAELRRMTTHPPIPLSGAISVPVTLAKSVPRDNDGQLDCGYHYPAVDWLATGLQVQNTTLVITNGAVVAVSSAGAACGIRLDSGGNLVSAGFPVDLNRFIRPHSVQEDTGTLNDGPMFDTLYPAAVLPNFQLRFTEIPLMDSSILFAQQNSLGNFQSLTLRDCQLKGGVNLLSPGNVSQTISCVNTLFERVNFGIYPYPPMTMNFRNNTFYEGVFQVTGAAAGASWSFFDNLFYKTALYQHPYAVLNHDHNAYIEDADRLLPFGEDDTIVPDVAFQSGPLGRYYLPAESGLSDAGSQFATSAGLYHFTTSTTASSKEGGTQVDIGLHFIAFNGSNQPLDFDGDGWPDYLEDANGNGSASPDPGETYWQTYTSPSGLSGNPGLVVFTPLK